MKQSAGLLLYSGAGRERRVLLVHASGPYNRKAPYSIPKGEPEGDEPLEAAARRETLEEVAVEVKGPLASLGHVDYQKTRKRVHAWAARLPDGATPRCASWEIDRAELLTMDRARELLHPDLRVFLDRLEALG